VYRYKRGARWWLKTPELEALAAAEQAIRFIVDAWEGPIREWLGNRADLLFPRFWNMRSGFLARIGLNRRKNAWGKS
jgi:hypothetical protein